MVSGLGMQPINEDEFLVFVLAMVVYSFRVCPIDHGIFFGSHDYYRDFDILDYWQELVIF